MLFELVTQNLAVVVSAMAALLFSLIEWRWPNTPYQFSLGWLARAIGLALIGVLFTQLLGNGFEDVFRSIRLFPALGDALNRQPVWLAGLFGYFVDSLFVYWWHRARHASDFCWRVFHQVHHSPHRLQAVTAFYAHPADFLFNTAMVNLVAYCLLGLNVQGAVWVSLWVGVLELWEHTNIRTPRWLGFIVVRPEMHQVHHERDVHASNYGLPVWDMLFGTYENSHRKVACGFDVAKEQRLLAMLACRDLHR